MRAGFRVLVLLAPTCAGALPLAHGQTLGEVLRATQKRWGLQDQGAAADFGSTTPQPIQWTGLSDASPSDATVNALPMESQIVLLRQAWTLVPRLNYSYYSFLDSRLISSGVGVQSSSVYFQQPARITPENFAWNVQRLAHYLSHQNTLYWPLSWSPDAYYPLRDPKDGSCRTGPSPDVPRGPA